jgi:hypothetical protein
MTPERLAQIRKATGIAPRAFDDDGRPIIRPGLLRDIGCLAISHRRELLEHLDEVMAENERLRNGVQE